MKFPTRLEQFLIAIDQLLNTVIGLFHARGAWADETISARAWREGRNSGKWLVLRRVIDTLFFWQEQHCWKAYLREHDRGHLHPEYRNDPDR